MTSIDRRDFLMHTAGAMAAMALVPDLSAASPIAAEPPVAIGVAGIGRQGRAMLAEMLKIDAARVVALCDVDPSRLSAGLRRAPGAQGFASHREMLDTRRDLQAVLVATPTHRHRAIVEDSLAAGRHVYCEAPLASTIDDARAIVRAARAADRVFQAGLQARTNPIYALARSFFRSGATRRLVSMRAQHHRKTTWRVPSPDPAIEKQRNWKLDPGVSIGLAGELGTQQFDVVHWFLGAHPVSVRGSGSIRLHDDGRTIPDTIHCDLDFPGGARLGYDATLANSFGQVREIFHGTHATILLARTAGWMFKEADAPTQGWEVYANRQQFHNDEGITLIADATKLAAQGKLKEGVGLPRPPLGYALEAFLKSVVRGDEVACTAEEGFRATAAGILADRAVRTGETVAITEEDLRAGG